MVAPNYQTLAFFICHLFIDGKFRTVHYLFDPNIFDDLLISEVNSICSDPIPTLTTDISKPISGTPEQYAQHKPILQLIFFDPNHLPKSAIKLRRYLTSHRLFIFCTPGGMDVKRTLPVLKKLKLFANSNSLILNFVQATNSINQYSISNDGEIIDDSVTYSDEKVEKTLVSSKELSSEQSSALSVKQDRQINTKKTSVFDRTFGIYEQTWNIWIKYSVHIPCHWDPHLSYDRDQTLMFSANLLYQKLNASLSSLAVITCVDNAHTIYYKVLLYYSSYKPSSFYKEFTGEHIMIEAELAEKMRNDRLTVLSLDEMSALNENHLTGNEIFTVNSYNSIELAVVLVYGEDLERRRDILYVDKWVQYMGLFTLFFWIAFAIVLHTVRRWRGIHHHGLISILIESAVPFIGVGTIQMDHRSEKIFFGMLLMLGVVTNPLWSDIFLVQTYQVMDEKVTTFDQLAKIHSKIFVSHHLKMHKPTIAERIRSRIRSNYTLADFEPHFIEASLKEEKSFIFVTDKSLLKHFETLLTGIKDFDILEDELGSLRSEFYLTAPQSHISQKLSKKVNQLTMSILANGLWRFYQSSESDRLNRRARLIRNEKYRDDDYEEGFDGITIKQMKMSVNVLLSGLAISLFVFIIEVIVFKVKDWLSRNRNRHQHQGSP